MPTCPARARVLLKARKAVVVRLHPFAIRLKDRVGGEVQPLLLTLDPGSKATGLALSRVLGGTRFALWLGELLHRGAAIRKDLQQRSGFRRRRRSKNLRYRAPRFDNRTRSKGWLAPSLRHRVDTSVALVDRLRKLAPITLLGLELVRFDLPKTHALDALCVGELEAVRGWSLPTLVVKATGRGSYQRTRLDAFGFPRGYLMRQKAVFGFRTGDLVRAVVPTGKKAGVHTGRVAVRASGSFNIQTLAGVVQGIGHKHCRVLMRGDGYAYELRKEVPAEKHSFPPRAEPRGFQEQP